MSEIRLRYAGLVVFASRIISIGTGFLFILMITRNVSGEEYGVWNNIFDVLGYFTLPAFIFPFWTSRFIARGHTGVAKTGLAANLIISLIVFPIYLVSIPIITSALHVTETQALAYTLVSLQIVESYILYVLEAIIYVKRPQMIGYASVTFEVTKVILGFALISWLKLLGAICVIIIAPLVQLALYLMLTISELKTRIEWNYTKEWLRASFFNIFSLVGQRIGALSLIFLFVLGGELARGFFGAAQTIAAVVGYSATLAFALYPKLLYEKRAEDASTSLKMILMFAIPMTAGAIVLSDSYLTILNPLFMEAKPILIILALAWLCLSISNFLETIIYGTERLDEKAKIPIRALVRSRMFLLATLPYIYSVVALPTVFYILTSAPRQPAEAALYLTLIDLTIGAAFLIIRYRMASKCLPFNFPRMALAKYCLASTAMVIVLLIIPQPTRLSLVVAATLMGAITYFAILYLIDRETREIMRLAMRTVQGSL